MRNPSDFFQLNVLWLKFSGLWVPKTSEKSYKYKKMLHVYNALSVSYGMAFFTISQIVALRYSYSNRETLIRNINMSSSYIVSCYKTFTWFYWRKDIVRTIDTLQNTFGIFEKFDDFDPKRVIAKRKTVQDYMVKLYQSMSVAVWSSCLIYNMIEVSRYGDKYEKFSNETGYRFERELPYQSWVPMDPKSSKVAHMGAIVMQVFGLVFGGAITVGLDMLYVGLIMGTTVHFELLQGAFRTIRGKCAKKLLVENQYTIDPPKLLRATDEDIRKYTLHLQTILEVCELLENIYSYVILTQLFVSLVALCTCLFLVSSIPIGTKLIGNELAYLLCVENQLILYCYTANELTDSAAGIPQSLYEGDWLSTSKAFRSYMKLTMLRMSKPVYLTIGKFMPLTLNTFVTIGRASYSLLALLKR